MGQAGLASMRSIKGAVTGDRRNTELAPEVGLAVLMSARLTITGISSLTSGKWKASTFLVGEPLTRECLRPSTIPSCFRNGLKSKNKITTVI